MNLRIVSLLQLVIFVEQFLIDSTVNAAPFGKHRCIVPTQTEEAIVDPQAINFPSCSNVQSSSDTATVLMGLYQFMSFLQRDVVGPVLYQHVVPKCDDLIRSECLPSTEHAATPAIFNHSTDEVEKKVIHNFFTVVQQYARMVHQVMTKNIVEDGTVDGHPFNSNHTIKRTLDILLNHLTSDQVYCQLKRLSNDTKPHQLKFVQESCQFSQATNCQSELREYTVLRKFQLYVSHEMVPWLLHLTRLHLSRLV